MTTKDDILGTKQDKVDTPPATSPNVATEDNSKSAPKPSKPLTAPKQAEKEPKTTTYEDIFKALNPYTPPTQEQLDKEKKKYQRDQMFAALGDGISAISNLHFTTQYAPNMYSGKNTMSERNKISYDKLLADRKENALAYYNGLVRAKQADDGANKADREWKRQLEADKFNKRKARKEAKAKAQAEANDKEQFKTKFEADQAQRKTENELAQQRINQGKDRNDIARAKQKSDGEKEAREANESRDKKNIGFSDGQGSNITINENVWAGSKLRVYDALIEDLPRKRSYKTYTEKEKEEYVKQNWYKSPKASKIMLEMSGFDTSTTPSRLKAEDDGIIDYSPSNEDEIIDYTPSK